MQSIPKLHFAILGFGIFGEKRLIPAFQITKCTELIAILKKDPQVAAQKAKQYKIPRFYTSKAELFQDKEIEAVFIATPNSYHLIDVCNAAKAGKSIILEKPMGIMASECEKMIEICENQRVNLMVAHCMRYNTTVLEFQERITRGEIGKIQTIRCEYVFNAEGYGRSWMLDQKIAGGGPVIDIGIHCIDLIRFLGGADIKEVHSYNTIPKNFDVEMASDIHCMLENGIIGQIYCSFQSPFHTMLEVIGEKGSLRADNFNRIDEKITIRVQKEYEVTTEIIENKNCYAAEIDAFSKAVLNRQPMPIPGIEGLKNQQIVDQILNYRSF
jgi:predicted dehydrogenase